MNGVNDEGTINIASRDAKIVEKKDKPQSMKVTEIKKPKKGSKNRSAHNHTVKEEDEAVLNLYIWGETDNTTEQGRKDSKKKKSKKAKKSNTSKSGALVSETTELHRRGRSPASKERKKNSEKKSTASKERGNSRSWNNPNDKSDEASRPSLDKKPTRDPKIQKGWQTN